MKKISIGTKGFIIFGTLGGFISVVCYMITLYGFENGSFISTIIEIFLCAFLLLFIVICTSLFNKNAKLIIENAKLITENTKLITENTKLISENTKLISENTKLITDNTNLESIVNDGLKYTYNKVSIYVDRENKKYTFSFVKHFTVMTDENPKWYKGQFYCNTKLESSNESKKFYDKNTPRWDELNFYSNLKYKRPSDKNIISLENLKVRPITDNSYYIPFHILFEKNDDKTPTNLLIEKGTEIELSYGYEVSADLWGSYINRSLSFFGEKASVTFQYTRRNNREQPIKLSMYEILKKTGEPQLIQEIECSDIEHNRNFNYYFDLPKVSSGKFRIYWDSNEILGINSAKIIADDSKMTDY